ncbi:MAG: hypothetical protein H8E05_00565 [Bacteroidetes bacterium]|nr:hypothetical protein [Bacteroidota bacterium]
MEIKNSAGEKSIMLNKSFIATLVLITIIFIGCLATTGCIFSKGGKKLGGGSVGKVVKPIPADEFNQSATFNPVVGRPQPIEKAKIEAVKSKPQNIEPKSVEATPIEPQKIPPAEWKRDFKPTVSPTTELPYVKIVPALPSGKKVNVKPINGNSKNGEANVDNETNVGVVDEEKENKMETNPWTDLIIFYGILIALALLIWLFLDKRDVGEGLINKIKNWWNGNKAQPKKVASKKRAPAKRAKRPVKKKPLASKGERKSNLAAKKSSSNKKAPKKSASKKKK